MASALMAIVLAAGKGTRMLSHKPKVVQEVFFAPMILHVLSALEKIDAPPPILVVGHGAEQVLGVLGGHRVTSVVQEQQFGTGHAVMSCREILDRHHGPVLILCGDSPLIKAETLRRFTDSHLAADAVLSLITTQLSAPSGYGRILYGVDGKISRIVEEKDADDSQKLITEVNAGIYCVDSSFLLEALGRIGSDNSQGELYLTDIVEQAVDRGISINRYFCDDWEEVLGVNNRSELARAHRILQCRHTDFLMETGVTIFQPDLVSIAGTVSIGRDTTIAPHCVITGKSKIGADVLVESFVKLEDCFIGDRATIGAFSHLKGRTVADDEVVPAHSVDILGGSAL